MQAVRWRLKKSRQRNDDEKTRRRRRVFLFLPGAMVSFRVGNPEVLR
jgi:hypothetical protein